MILNVLLLAILLGLMAIDRTPLSIVSAALATLIWWLRIRARNKKFALYSDDEKRQAEKDGVDLKKESFLTIAGRMILVLVILFCAFFGTRIITPGFLLDWPGQNTLLYERLEKAQTEFNYGEELSIIRERLEQPINDREREVLEREEVQTLMDWGSSLMEEGNFPVAIEKWKEAENLADQYNDENRKQVVATLLAPTLTPRPTQTLQPTFTLQPTQTKAPTQTPLPTYTPQPALPAGFNDCVGATLIQTLDPADNELLQLYSCEEDGLYKVVWLIAATTNRPGKQYSSLLYEGDRNGATFIPAGRSSFTVIVVEGEMQIKHY